MRTGSGAPWPDSVGGWDLGWLPGLPSSSKYAPFPEYDENIQPELIEVVINSSQSSSIISNSCDNIETSNYIKIHFQDGLTDVIVN